MRPLVGFALLSLVLGSCGPTRAPEPPDLLARSLQEKGFQLELACTPTGPELCFNARDDNCNGIVDEGCGSTSGIVQFMIAWEGKADIDLSVRLPEGDVVNTDTRHASGFTFERDCPRDSSCLDQNTENIYFARPMEPPRGTYVVRMSLSNAHGADLPVKVNLGAKIGRRVYQAEFSIHDKDEPRTLTFEL